MLWIAPQWWAARAVAARTLLEWAKLEHEDGRSAARLRDALEHFDSALSLLGAARAEAADVADIVTFKEAADAAQQAEQEVAQEAEEQEADEAEEAVEGSDPELIELLNDRGVALYELAMLPANLLLASGLLAQARAAFIDVLELSANHARARCNLGLVEWADGHERAAQHAFDKAVGAACASQGSSPGSSEVTAAHAHNNRGALLFEQGEAERAVGDFHAALHIDPSYEAARRNRDAALSQLGEPVPLHPVDEPHVGDAPSVAGIAPLGLHLHLPSPISGPSLTLSDYR